MVEKMEFIGMQFCPYVFGKNIFRCAVAQDGTPPLPIYSSMRAGV